MIDKEKAGIKGIKINTSKTESIICAKTDEALMIRDKTGQCGHFIKTNPNIQISRISNER